MVDIVRRLLAEPAAGAFPLDDPRTTACHRDIIVSKRFLRRIYDEWYGLLADVIPQGEGAVLEIGSGGGFFASAVPSAISSDVQVVPGIDVVLDAIRLPMADGALRAIVMTNVFHHLPDAGLFLSEVQRSLRPGGVLAMIEPWVTAWSRRVYRTLHHEPFEPAAERWQLDPGGPLTAANGALPWIIFQRDRHLFESRFPGLAIARVDPIMPVRYLISGGVSMRAVVPSWSFGFWRRIDESLVKRVPASAMFARLVVRRTAR